jgi:hypothetical protein
MASLFTSQTPALGDAADGTDSYSMCTYFTPAVDGTITHIRWWFPASGQPGGVAPKANLFRTSDSSKIGGADVTFAYPGTPGGWNQIALAAPVSVVSGEQYAATIWTPLRYVASSGGSSPWPLTNGNLSTPSNAGRFTSGASGNVDFPTGSFNNGCYFVDAVFVPTGGTTPVSSSLDLRWGVRNTVSSTTDLRWAVRNVISSAVDLRWGVRGIATSTTDLRWGVRNVVSSTLDARWAVRNTVSADLDLRWAQRALVSSTVDLRWAQAGRVSSDLDVRWAVRGVTASTLDARWAVRNQISAPLDLRWAVRGLVSSPLSLLWQVDGAPLPTERVASDVAANLTDRITAWPVPATIRAYLGPR